MRPLVVASGSEAGLAAARELEAAGWLGQRGFVLMSSAWDVSDARIVCIGEIAGPDDAGRALLAASRGAGLIVSDGGAPEVMEALIEDLTRLGPVQHRHAAAEAPPTPLDSEQRRLLDLLAQGGSLGEAARALHLSRRTVDRRLAAARRTLGVATTTEAVRRAVRTADAASSLRPGSQR